MFEPDVVHWLALPADKVVQLVPLQYCITPLLYWMLPGVLLLHVPVPTMTVPTTCNVVFGVVVPMPRLPLR
jgi:hypothetical protein